MILNNQSYKINCEFILIYFFVALFYVLNFKLKLTFLLIILRKKKVKKFKILILTKM